MKLLSAKEAAEALAVSTKTLKELQTNGEGPPYLYVGKTIKYPQDKLIKWIERKIREVVKQTGGIA